MLERAAAQVAPLGWHVQIYCDLEVLSLIALLLRTLSVPVVSDHKGGAARSPAPWWQPIQLGRCGAPTGRIWCISTAGSAMPRRPPPTAKWTKLGC